MKKLRALVVTGAIAILVMLGSTVPAQAATYRSDVNMSTACAQQHPGTFPGLQYYDVTGWRCYTSWSGGPVVIGGLNLNAYCVRRIGSGAYAAYTSYNNPYSWGCYR